MKVVIGDFETTPFDYEKDDNYLLHARFCCFKDIGTQEKFFFNLEQSDKEMIEFIKKLGTKRKACRLYFHNVNFDIAFLFKLLPKDADYKIVKNGSRIIQFKIYRTVLRKDGRKARNTILDIRNSISIFPTSIKSLGKSLGFEKMEQDYFSETITQEYIDYCYRDIEILEVALRELIVNEFELYRYRTIIDKLPLTISSLNKKEFHFINVRKYGKQFYSMIYDRNQDYIENRLKCFFFGGRVEVFRFDVCKEGSYNDVNSEYPWAMFDKFFPLAPYKESKCDSQDKCWLNWNENDLFFGAICEVEENQRYPLVPSHIEGTSKIIFANGVKKCFLFRFEIEKLLQLKQKVRILSLWSCSGYAKIFDEYISRAYEQKKNSEGFKREHSKLKMNGLYGKFGESKEKEIVEILNCNLSELTDQELLKIEVKETYDNDIVYIRRDLEVNNFLKTNIIFAMLITARARFKIWEIINEVKHCWYCDTDSTVDKEIHEYSNELGGLKSEFDFTEFQALGCKEYAFYTINKCNCNHSKEKHDDKGKCTMEKCDCKEYNEVSFKMKGFGKLQKYTSLIEFKQQFFDDKKQHRQVGFLEAFNRKMPLNQMLVFDKKKHGVYDKRWINKDLSTTAFHLQNDDFNEMVKNNAKMIQFIVSGVYDNE